MSKCLTLVIVLFSLGGFFPLANLSAQDRKFFIESFTVKGSERLTADFFATELGLSDGGELGQAQLDEIRNQLLGTGLFRSANFYLQKGSEPGRFQLQIDLEEDPSVFSDWALGNSLYLTQQPDSQTLSKESSPLGAKLQVIARNIFRRQHRGSLELDYDGMGILRRFQFAYGFPRFTAEGVQFDARIEAVDPAARYVESLGFGQKGEAFWTFSIAPDTEFLYGAAFYLNQDRRFKIPDFPKNLLGPKLGLRRETRLLSFRPTDGGAATIAAVLASEGKKKVVLEAEGAYTLGLWTGADQTVEATAMSVGGRSFSYRASWRLEQALPGAEILAQPKVYVLAITGGDRYEQIRDRGYEYRAGTRFHSNGFIADIAFIYRVFPERLEQWRDER